MINIISKLFMIWVLIIYVVLYNVLKNTTDDYKHFYRFGPNPDLIIMGIQINTMSKYYFLITYSFVNSVFRTIHHNYLHPWILSNVQNETKNKDDLNHYSVYQIVTISTIYNWTDWLLYMNILLSQIDMMIVEIIADLAISYITTYYYLKTPAKKKHTWIDETVKLLDEE